MKSEIVYLKPEKFNTAVQAHELQACVIGLHGLGASGSDFMGIPSLLSGLKHKITKPIKFIFPNAPIRSITANQGLKMPGWYDINAWGNLRQEDLLGLAQSRELILDLIQKEIIDTGLPAHKIFLMGFSQGGALALSTALQETRGISVGGVIGLSCYLPGKAKINMTPQKKLMPILIIHGIEDDIVPCALGEETSNHLSQLGFNIEFHRLPHLAHQINSRVLQLVDRFLVDRL
jgi:phospholipase/carboxylesterase